MLLQLLLDTVNPIVKNIQIEHISNPAEKRDFLIKYAPLISPIVVILTFLFNNWYNVRTKKKESKRNWYFKAYFEPNMKEVESFFSQASSIMDVAQIEYQKSNKWKEATKIQFIGKTLLDLANLKRMFSIKILTALEIPYPKEFNEIENILNDFEDAGSEAFGEAPSQDSYYSYITKITEIKSKLIHVLSGPALI